MSKSNNKVLTLEYLEEHSPSKYITNFAKRNKLVGLPFDCIKDIKGRYSEFGVWIKEEEDREYDGRGNVIAGKNCNGCWQYEYDGNDRVISQSQNGPCGYSYKTEYKCDSHGNVINKTISDVFDGGESNTEYNYTYYDNGQLKSMEENGKVILEIPYFENNNMEDKKKRIDGYVAKKVEGFMDRFENIGLEEIIVKIEGGDNISVKKSLLLEWALRVVGLNLYLYPKEKSYSAEQLTFIINSLFPAIDDKLKELETEYENNIDSLLESIDKYS